MKLKPVPDKFTAFTHTAKDININDSQYVSKLNEIIDYQEYLREIVQNLEDNRRNK